MMFDYREAFSRNLGWISEYEQMKLKETRIAIAGMGGVGGIYLLTCVRMGFEKFNLSEFDTFELGNFNRQVGSSLLTVGRPKLDVMIEQALSINPNLEINSFPKGITAQNTSDFLKDCSVYLDGIDFFETGVRRMIFKECQRLGIVGITSIPAGMGFAQLVFGHESPDFDKFFDFDSYSKEYESLLFLVGIAPKGLHRASLHDPSRIHFADRKVSSTFMGCQLCAGSVVTEAVKHILDRGNKMQAPHGLHYDAHSNTFKKTFLGQGNKSLLQKFKVKMAMKEILQKNDFPYPYHPDYEETSLPPSLQKVLDLAKWAPNIDNEQPHHVSIQSSDTLLVSVDSFRLCVDDQEKEHMSSMFFGTYFESLRQAASLYGFDVAWEKMEKPFHFQVRFKENPSIQPEKTALYLRARFTDRRSYRSTPLSSSQLQALKDEIDPEYSFSFQESFQEKWEFACFEAKALSSQLSDVSSVKVLLSNLDFNNPYSLDKMPIDSIGLSPLNKLIAKFVIKRPTLMTFLSKFGGTFPVQLDYAFMPHIRCAGHFILTRDMESSKTDTLHRSVKEGQMIQRFWLKATSLGLALQPNYLQIAISRNDYFQKHPLNGIRKKAKKIRDFLQRIAGNPPEQIVLMGRLGVPKDRKVYSRSTRHKA